MINKTHLDNLRKAYKEKRLVPFIGSGLAIPFGIPSWGKLIKEIAETNLERAYIPSINRNVELGNYWNAIRDIKEFCTI